MLFWVQVVGEKLVHRFSRHHAAQTPLRAWLQLMKANHAHNFPELKRTFGSVDYLSIKKSQLCIFNIGGNKYRLIAAVHYKSQMVFIRYVLTHAEYYTGGWKQNP